MWESSGATGRPWGIAWRYISDPLCYRAGGMDKFEMEQGCKVKVTPVDKSRETSDKQLSR